MSVHPGEARTRDKPRATPVPPPERVRVNGLRDPPRFRVKRAFGDALAHEAPPAGCEARRCRVKRAFGARVERGNGTAEFGRRVRQSGGWNGTNAAHDRVLLRSFSSLVCGGGAVAIAGSDFPRSETPPVFYMERFIATRSSEPRAPRLGDSSAGGCINYTDYNIGREV